MAQNLNVPNGRLDREGLALLFRRKLDSFGPERKPGVHVATKDTVEKAILFVGRLIHQEPSVVERNDGSMVLYGGNVPFVLKQDVKDDRAVVEIFQGKNERFLFRKLMLMDGDFVQLLQKIEGNDSLGAARALERIRAKIIEKAQENGKSPFHVDADDLVASLEAQVYPEAVARIDSLQTGHEGFFNPNRAQYDTPFRAFMLERLAAIEKAKKSA